jgi:hypothetical protein
MRFHVEQLESRGRHHFGQRTAEHHHHGRARCLRGQTGCTTRDPPRGFPPFRTTYGTTAETSPQRRLTRIVGVTSRARDRCRRRPLRIFAGSLSDPARGVRSRGERRPAEGRRDKER